MSKKNKRKYGPLRWLQSTPRRTFVLYPVIIIMIEYMIYKGDMQVNYWGLPLLPWGYLQYRLSGNYRTIRGGGGPGFDIPPERIVNTGIYAITRNPMYIGHLVFMTGLVISFNSVPAIFLLLFHFYWFNERVKNDEVHLIKLFGDKYIDYMNQVNRWLPGKSKI